MKPRRLEWRGGQWTLTVETLVAVAPDLFVPSRYEVEGPDSIAATLTQMGEAERLCRQAHQLFGHFASGSADDIAFEPRDGAWLPVAPEPKLVEARREAPREVAPEEVLQRIEQRIWMLDQRFARVAELERRVARMQTLERRVAKLEEALARGVVPAAQSPAQAEATQGDAALASSDRAGEAEADGAARPPTGASPTGASPGGASPGGASPGSAPPQSGRPAAGSGPPEHESDGDETQPRTGAADEPEVPTSPDEPEAPRFRCAIDLPGGDQIEAALQMLLGDDDIVLTESREPPSLKPRDVQGWQVSWLRDDAGEVLGAMAADLKATVVLGGSLLMVPESAQKEHIAARKPSEEEVEAIAEIFNNMTPAVNSVPENPHVRSSAAETLTIAPDSWLLNPGAVATFKTDFGGRLFLFARSLPGG